MPGMPYHLEKGAWLSVVEDYLNGDAQRPLDALEQLRSNTPIAQMDWITTVSLDGDPDYPDTARRREHLEEDWLGYLPVAGQVEREAPGSFFDELTRLAGKTAVDTAWLEVGYADNDTPAQRLQRLAGNLLADDHIGPYHWPNTGFWFQYFGDVEGIVRRTLIATIETAFGIEHGADTSTATRRLPIEMYWKCPQRWFEGWITWRWDDQALNGQVTTFFCTPGSGKPLLENPLLGHGADPDPTLTATGDRQNTPGVQPPPAGAQQAAKGMWVVCQEAHAQLPSLLGSEPSEFGAWTVPAFGPTYVGIGDVLCVSPSEADGGVRPFGRAWSPTEATAPSPTTPSEEQACTTT